MQHLWDEVRRDWPIFVITVPALSLAFGFLLVTVVRSFKKE